MIRIHRVLLWSAVILIITSIGVGHSLALQFRGLGGLPVLEHGDQPGARPESYAFGISGDGSTIVGQSAAEKYLYMDSMQAFRWTLVEGMISLDEFGNGQYSLGSATSFDGSVVVGTHDVDDGFVNAFRWTEQTGLVYLVESPQYTRSRAYDVSADGTVIIGFEAEDKSLTNKQAVIWTDSGQSVAQLGTLGGNESWANGVSADGSLVVGTSKNESGQIEAFLWNDSDGMAGLGTLAGYSSSTGVAVSADGATVVGSSSSGTGAEAYRWTQSDGMVGLGDLVGGETRSSANAVSADGSIVVGSSQSANGDEAFIWDAKNGMRSILDHLENDYASDMSGWILLSATGISDDGSVISGYGINPEGHYEAWMVDYNAVPIPSTVWLMVTGVIGIAALRFKMIKP